MSCQDKFARLINKAGEGVPTIPASADHQNGDWLETDVYEGEFYEDLDTGIVYYRSSTGIITIYGSSISSTVTIDKTEINGMDATPVVLLSIPAGLGARFVKVPVVKVDSDGANFVFASSETMQLHNSETLTSGNVLATWGDPFITSDGTYQASPNFSGYELVTGDITVTSTANISSGGAGSEMTFYLEYELFTL